MNEELLFGFSKQQIGHVDMDALRAVLDEDFVGNGNKTTTGLKSRQKALVKESDNQPLLNGLSNGVPKRVSQHPDEVDTLETRRDRTLRYNMSADDSKRVTERTKLEPMPIAIVGISCRFPGGANNLQDMEQLCIEGRSTWSHIPKERFDAEAFYHPNPERVASMNVKSGHFLHEDQYGYFDASFFNISPNEAKARLHLEGAYEAFENAGIPINTLVGSNTSVFVGASNEEYGKLMGKDQNTFPTYRATGSGISMLSNRISHWFDFRGPSISLDTACSASAAALHLGCETLRSGESKVSIVSGANLMLEPELMFSLSALNFLSPDGRTYMFDKRANGYARGEGIATLILKPLSDALTSNDPVHAVIRNTGTNQDGKTPGITLPSMAAQQALIEKTHSQAGLDVLETDFFEAHGTGTRAGDRTEAEALSNALHTFHRPAGRPMSVGSVKTLIGHCEGASGIAGVVHAVLALKQKQILPNSNFKIPSDEIKFQEWKIQVPTKPQPWESHGPRRASINSFGYGGSNVHMILEEAPRRRPMANGNAPVVPRGSPRKILMLSANDEESLQKLASNVANYARDAIDPKAFDNLIYTFGQRRSLLRYRFACQSSSMPELAAAIKNVVDKPSIVTKEPRLCFVFTGQGSQWAKMGCDLLDIFPVYRAAFTAASHALASAGAEWSLLDELSRETRESRIDDAFLSQPLCTALQIALVDLIKSWGIVPKSVIGHSSGEIAAAYCAGMLSLESAMHVAYYRGVSVLELKSGNEPPGAMMAVGLSSDEIRPRLLALKTGTAVVACINSPQSVTVSGDKTAVEELQSSLNELSIFSRMLRVNVAYHSQHMHRVSKNYRERLSAFKATPAIPSISFHSTVFPGIPLTTNAEYWVQNLVNPVRFMEGVQMINLLQSSESHKIDTFIEIGPHSSLAGPLKQIFNELAPGLRPSYLPSLERQKPAIESLLSLASKLFVKGVPVHAENINFPFHDGGLEVLTDLPTYPWNHSSRHWHENRILRNYLRGRFPPHDLLGTLSDDSSDLDMRWTNRLRVTDIPWLLHHTANSEPLFPGAGYAAMAIEASRQKATLTNSQVMGYSLRDVHFHTALMIPDTPDGVEIAVTLVPLRESPMSNSKIWDCFRVISYSSDRTATEHCNGLVSTSQGPGTGMHSEIVASLSKSLELRQQSSNLDETMASKRREFGVNLEQTFSLLSQYSMRGNESCCDLKIPDTRSYMPYKYESSSTIKPQVIDAAFQVAALGFVSFVEDFKDALVPTFVEEIFICKDIALEEGHIFHAKGKTYLETPRHFSGESILADSVDGTMEPVMSVKAAKYLVTSALRGVNEAEDKSENQLCWHTVWKPDVTLTNPALIQNSWKKYHLDSEEMSTRILREKATYFVLKRAVNALTVSDQKQVLPHHQHYLKWAYESLKKADAGSLMFDITDCQEADTRTADAVMEQANRSSTQGKMLYEVGRQLISILRQEIDPLSVMMQDGLLDKFYTESPGQDRAYEHAAEYVDLAVHKWPDMKILEIGAGTGSATSFMLRTLGSEVDDFFRCSSYTFTDISAGFFEKAREKFSKWDTILNFKALNIENDAQSQGFNEGGYDLIIAANVLHATAFMENTMKNVNRLLRPGGKLVLVEVTNLNEMSGSAVFGLTPGWWLGVPDGRIDSPLLTEEGWNVLLRQSGFTGLEISAPDAADDSYAMSTIVTTKCDEVESKHIDNITLVHVSGSGGLLANRLKEALRKQSTEMTCTVTDIKELSACTATYVVIDDDQNPVLGRLTQEDIRTLREICAAATGLLWISFNGLMGHDHPEAGAATGFLRTLRAEYGTLQCVSLDYHISQTQSIEIDLSAILAVMDRSFGGPSRANKVFDSEYVIQEGQIMIPRIVEDKEADKSITGDSTTAESELQPLVQPGYPLTLSMRHQGLLDTFQFVFDTRASEEIEPHDVEIQIKSVGLNFHDLLVATEQTPDFDGYGVECSGLVTKIGKDVNDFHLGQRVCALSPKSFSIFTRTRENLVCAIPEDMSFEVAASIPHVFSTSYYSIFQAAKLQPGETILIHAAAGGIGQACIKLACLIGAEIYVTVGSSDKASFVEKTFGLPRNHILNSRDLSFRPRVMELTAGKGVDVIINSLSGEALRESWRCIAALGRFIELGKVDSNENAYLGMAPFERGASFIAVGLDVFRTYKDAVPGEALQRAVGLIARKEISPIDPIKVYQMSEVEEAFRFMQSGTHIGKLVFNVTPECLVPVVPKAPPKFQLQNEASYLLVGGLSGIGAAFAKWMVLEWGAKNLILLSRSGLKAKGSKELVQSLQQAGAVIRVEACDVTDTEQLESTLDECARSLPPIQGVIQGAMVLQDSIFAKMDLSKFNAALRPKIHGTRNLHEYFISRSTNLNFFVMLSSLAGINGNPSQSNYAAGNTYQDALAYYRVARGLPALAIDVGFVEDTGWTAENLDRVAAGVGLAWAKRITSQHLLRLIEYNILSSADEASRLKANPQVSIGIGQLQSFDARFSHIEASRAQSKTHQTAADQQVPLAQKMAAIGSDKALLQEAIQEGFSHKLSRLLDLPIEDIHSSESLSVHGVDSLVAVEIRNWLNRETGATVPMSDVMSGKKTIARMVEDIVEEKVKS